MYISENLDDNYVIEPDGYNIHDETNYTSCISLGILKVEQFNTQHVVNRKLKFQKPGARRHR